MIYNAVLNLIHLLMPSLLQKMQVWILFTSCWGVSVCDTMLDPVYIPLGCVSVRHYVRSCLHPTGACQCATLCKILFMPH